MGIIIELSPQMNLGDLKNWCNIWGITKIKNIEISEKFIIEVETKKDISQSAWVRRVIEWDGQK